MKVRNLTTMIAVAMVLAIMMAPMLSDDADADGDIVLYCNIDSIELLSNDSSTIQVIVSNYAGVPCEIRMTSTHDNGDYSVSYDVKEFTLGNGDNQIVNVRLSTEKYAETRTDTLSIGVEYIALSTSVVQSNTVDITVHTNSTYNEKDSFNKILGIFDNPLPEPLNSVIVTTLITLLIWLIIGTIGSILSVIIVHLIIFRRDTSSDAAEAKKVLKTMRKFIFGIFFIYGCANTMKVFGMDVEIVGTFTELSKFLFVVFGGTIAWKIVGVEIDAIGKKLDNNSKFDPSILPLFKIIAEMVVMVATIAVALAIYGVDFVAIVTGLGLLTTGLSFGAKNIINQFLSGVIMLTERPFVKGDKVKVDLDNASTLVVNQVGYMTTRFKNWTNEEMIVIPNSTLMNSMLTNITRDNSLYRVYDYYSISYASDIAKAKEIMLEVALDHDDVIVDQLLSSPNINFDEVNRNCVNLRLSFIVKDHENYGTIAGVIRHRIFNRFCEEGVDIPYDQYSINLVRLKRVEDEVAPDA